MNVRAGPGRRLSAEELMLSKCGAGETLVSTLDSKIIPINPRGNQPWIFPGRTDAEVKAPILWPSDERKLTYCKRPWSCKDWVQEDKAVAEDEIIR